MKSSYDKVDDKNHLLMTLIPLGVYFVDLFLVFNSSNYSHHITKVMVISMCVYGLNSLKKLISIIAK